MMQDTSTAFIILSGNPSKKTLEQKKSIEESLIHRADVYVVGYANVAASEGEQFWQQKNCHRYDEEKILHLGYPKKTQKPFQLIPGNTDAPVLRFHKDHPHYDNIWLMEDDVVFTGPMSDLLDAFKDSQADLLATNMGPCPEKWIYTTAIQFPAGWGEVGRPDRVFLPIYRISRQFLKELDEFYVAGGAGHYERVWIYVAKQKGLKLEDIGGSGPYVRSNNRNRFYTSQNQLRDHYPGTFRYWPFVTSPGRRKSTLWHPVKEVDDISFIKKMKQRWRPFARYVANRLTGRDG